MAKNQTFCTRYAKVNVNGSNEDSKLHKALLDHVKNRPIANLIYAMYLQQGVADDMDNKYQRNTQNQHSASAVLEYFKFQNIVTDILDSSIEAVEKSKGVRDNDGKLHNFTDPVEAYTVAKEINELTNAQGESLHLAATVTRHGTNFQVIVDPISSNTNLRQRTVNNALFLWDAFKHTMGFNGVDVDNLRTQFSDILNLDTGMIRYIENTVATDNKYLTPREIQFFLAANSKSNNTIALINAFGTLENTAQAIYDNYHIAPNPAYAGLIDRTLTESKKLFSVLDSAFNAQTIDKVVAEDASAYETSIQNTLKQLNYKYNIDFTEVKIEEKHAKSLSEVTARAVATLERRINQLEAKAGNTEEIKNLSKLRNTLLKELESKRYYLGLLNYIDESYDVITTLEDNLNNLPQTGNQFEDAVALAKVLRNQNIFVNGYANLFRDILEDLTYIDALIIDESVAQSDIDTLQQTAKKAHDLLLKVKNRGESLNRQCMIDICTHIFKGKADPATILNLIETGATDTGLTDVLYSFGKLSDARSAAIGTIVRDAQDKRNQALTEITIKIREATDKLYKSGSNSEFMYEDDGHILSDYDWNAYQKAWSRQKEALKIQNPNITDFELEEAMEQWEENNTEECVYNKAERIPKLSLYRKKGPSFRDRLTPAQNEYYDTMMQLKGELGAMLPEWAQVHYLPPQIRRDLITAATHIKQDGVAKFGAALQDKLEELYKVKQDDTEWGIEGEREVSYAYAKGDLSGRQIQQIPIFFVKKLSNQDELFKNFSAGMQALAATTLNYYYLSDIVDMAEFMRDYVRNTEQRYNINGKLGTEISGNRRIKMSSTIAQVQQGLPLFILDNMFDKHFYGVSLKGNPFLAKTILNLVKYTSFKGLATNVFGAAANALVGEQQLLQRALSGTLYKVFTKFKQPTPYFGISDWALGFSKLFGAVGEAAVSLATGKNTSSVILDLITNNKQSKDYLMAEYFDLFNENYGSMMHTNYHKGFRQLLHDISFILYGAGEKAIRYNTLWAMENAKKLRLNNGKIINLRQAFYKTGPKSTPHLVLLSDLYDLNGEQITDSNGNLTEYGQKYLTKFKKDLRYCCQGMFGAMNDEDKGIIHMHAVTRSAMNFRQWAVAHYSERFRGIHWDVDAQEFVRGYWTSSGRYLRKSLTTEEAQDLLESGHKIKFMGQFIKDLFTFRTKFIREWTKSSDVEKMDLMRLMSAVIIYGLNFCSACWIGGGLVPKLWWGDEEEEKERKKQMSPSRKFMYYQMKRLLYDAESSTPVGAFTNFETMIKSPIPAINTFDNAMYFITGIGDLGTPLKSGPDKYMDKYWRNVLKYNLPFWRDYRRLKEFEESDAMFGIFESDNLK